MSNQSIIEHKANMFYIEFREDYLQICLNCTYKKPLKGEQKCKASPYCKALILAIMESWTNDKRGKGQDLSVYMTYPQWIDAMYGMFGRTVVIDSLDELLGEKLISRESYRMFGKDTFKYLLNCTEINKRMKALEARDPSITRPLVNASTNKSVASTSKRVTRPLVNEDPSTSKHNIYTTNNLNLTSTEREFASASADRTPSLSSSSNTDFQSSMENFKTSLQEPVESSPSEVSLLPSQMPENSPSVIESVDSTPTTEKASQVAKPQAIGDIPIVATSQKPAKTTKKRERTPSTKQHHPDLGKWYGMFNETYRELGKKDGIPANFAIPSQKNYTEAFEAMIEAGVTLEQAKWTLKSIWNDPDPFWRDKRTPTAMRSQYLARVSRMPRNLHIVPEQEPVIPVSSEPVDPSAPVARWTRLLDQKEVLRLSLEDRKEYFVWKNAQKKVG